MVAPQDSITQQTNEAEASSKQNFRFIRRARHKRDASTRQAQYAVIPNDNGKAHPIRAGGHSGPPLRGGFVSIKDIIKTGSTTKQSIRNARRDRHKRDASTRQAQHRHQQQDQDQDDRIDTRGRTRRSAPTQRNLFDTRHQLKQTNHTLGQSKITLSIQTILQLISRFTFPTVLGTLS